MSRHSPERAEVVAATADLRVTEFTLAPGQEIPWHWHSAAPETFFCLAGTLEIETRAPSARVRLEPGERQAMPARRAHRVRNPGPGPTRYLLVQGVGPYDFNPVGGGGADPP